MAQTNGDTEHNVSLCHTGKGDFTVGGRRRRSVKIPSNVLESCVNVSRNKQLELQMYQMYASEKKKIIFRVTEMLRLRIKL